MPVRTGEVVEASAPSRHRCRCGHWPTDHLAVVPIGTTGNFRLEPIGPCAVCGEAVCRKFTPAAA